MKKDSATSQSRSVDRRRFLKGAAAGAAGAAIMGGRPLGASSAPPARPAALPPTEAALARETQAIQRTPAVESYIVETPASDHMVDVLRALDLEYCTSNPGSSFDGLQESIVNYGDNRMPEFLTCLHEESAVAMALGYAKVEGKPMMALLHGTVGLQHATMAIYNAYADRVPVYIVVGLDNDGPVAAHNAIDMAAMVRDFVKWDHQPDSLGQFGQSAVRAYTLATTPPMAPVLLVLDAKLQKAPLEGAPSVPRLSPPRFPSADTGSVKEIARLLVEANNPRITAGQAARTQEGIDLLVELAELLQAPVNDEQLNVRGGRRGSRRHRRGPTHEPAQLPVATSARRQRHRTAGSGAEPGTGRTRRPPWPRGWHDDHNQRVRVPRHEQLQRPRWPSRRRHRRRRRCAGDAPGAHRRGPTPRHRGPQALLR